MKNGVGRPTKQQLAEEQIRRANGDYTVPDWRKGEEREPIKRRYFRIDPYDERHYPKRPHQRPPDNAPKLTPELIAKGQAKSLQVRRANSRNPQRIVDAMNNARWAKISIGPGVGIIKEGHLWWTSVNKRRTNAKDFQDAMVKALAALEEAMLIGDEESKLVFVKPHEGEFNEHAHVDKATPPAGS